MATKTFALDAAERLDSPEANAAYPSEIMTGGDAAKIMKAIGTMAQAQGMTAVARDAGAERESLYKALSGEGNPEFGTIMKVLGVLSLALPSMRSTPPPIPSITHPRGEGKVDVGAKLMTGGWSRFSPARAEDNGLAIAAAVMAACSASMTVASAVHMQGTISGMILMATHAPLKDVGNDD
jgi:probable addiction module antidote protein